MTGSSAAAPLWALYMQKLLKEKDHVKFPVPEGIKFAAVDTETGYLADSNTKNKIRVGIKEEVELTPPPPPAKPEAYSDDDLQKLPPVPIEEEGLPEL